MSLPQASRGAADSVQGPRGLVVVALTTSAAYADLSAWAGRYVRLRVEGCNAYYSMHAATSAAIDETDTSGALTVDYLADGGQDDFLVDAAFPHLAIKAKADTGYARISAR